MTGEKTVSHIRNEILLHSNRDVPQKQMWGNDMAAGSLKCVRSGAKAWSSRTRAGSWKTLFHASVWNVLLHSCNCRRRKHSRLAKYELLNICVQLSIKEVFQKTAPASSLHPKAPLLTPTFLIHQFVEKMKNSTKAFSKPKKDCRSNV